MVSHLQHVNPDSEVLLVGILPCAAETSPGPEGLFAWPNGLSAGISKVNEALEDFASQHHLVHYVDCADEMLLQGQVRHQAYSGNPRVTKGLCFCIKGCCSSLLCLMCARGCCKSSSCQEWQMHCITLVNFLFSITASLICSWTLTSCVEHL